MSTTKQLIDEIVQHPPVWFRNELTRFDGSLSELHAALLEVLAAQKHEMPRTHVGMVLMCVGHPAGTEVFFKALRGTEPKPRNYALTQMSSIWAHQRVPVRADCELPISIAQLLETLAPFLDYPDFGDGKIALEFMLAETFEASRPLTRRLLKDVNPDVRDKVAGTYLRHGVDDGALDVASTDLVRKVFPFPNHVEEWRRQAAVLGGGLAECCERAESPLKERAIAVAMRVLRHTAVLGDAGVRTLDKEGRGYFDKLLLALHGAQPAGVFELLQEVAQSRTVAPFARASAFVLAAKLNGLVEDKANASVSQMVRDTQVSQYARARLLSECVALMGRRALRPLLVALKDANLREAATALLLQLAQGRPDTEIVIALKSAMVGESRAWVAARIARGLVGLGDVSQVTIDRLHRWDAMDFRWRKEGITHVEAARLLTQARAMDAISPEELVGLGGKNAKSILYALLSHGREADARLAYNSTRDVGYDPQHQELLSRLAGIVRPPLRLEGVSQERHELRTETDAASAGLQMVQDGEPRPVPEHLLRGVPLVSFEGTTCVVRFTHEGREHSFTARADSSSLDVRAVLDAFNSLMAQIGRPQRAFRLGEDPDLSDTALFVCADGASFEEAARKLHIPLER
ncbi:MAG: hypothetical protein ACJ8R9_30380 [Steroidobacteraceae bacterium]